jgi:hypothetical protein
MTREEGDEAYIKVRFYYLPVETERNHEKRLSEYPFSRSILVPGKYQARSRSAVFGGTSIAYDIFQAAEFCSSA